MPRIFVPHFFLILLFTGLSAGPIVRADSIPTVYFYHGLAYGSQANFSPGNVIINGGYGILQIPYYTNDKFQRQIFRSPYGDWTRNVWQTLRHPLRAIDEFGWDRFINSEILPFKFEKNNNAWVPNYFLHTIAAGMLSRETEEWYRHHGVPWPRVWSIATMAVYHGLSEVVENRGFTGATVDHLADIYIFDPLGIWLFTNDGVCRFFSRTLNLAEWSMQPAYNLRSGNLENMGQFYVMKFPFTRDRQWQVIAHFGLHGMAGISRRFASGDALSVTAGFMVEDLVPVDPDQEEKLEKGVLTWRAGFFYDRDNSLQASLLVSSVPQRRLILNLYPGALRIGPVRPGLFVLGTHEWCVGLCVNVTSFGAAWSR